jgi:hypothetical protein
MEKVLDALGEAVSKLIGEPGESLATVQRFDVPLLQTPTCSLEVCKRTVLAERPITREVSPQPRLTINVPSGLIRILPWTTGEWATTTTVSANQGGPASS